MKIALVQFNVRVKTPAENIRRGLELSREAARSGASLLLLPEMWSTGLHPGLAGIPEVDATAEILAEISGICKDSGCTVAAGSLPERRTEGIFNTAWLVTPEGVAPDPYRKIHLFKTGGEDRYTRAGDRLARWGTPAGPASPAICFDLRFPELFRAAAFAGATLFLHPTQWPKSRTAHYRALLPARAIENQAFVLSANACGNDGLLDMAGGSTAIDPWGETLVEAPAAEEGVFTAELDPAQASSLRAKFPFLREAVHAGIYDPLRPDLARPERGRDR